MKSAACITIKGPGRMTAKGRRSIAQWMIRQARHLQGYGWRYTHGKYSAWYNY